MVEDLSLFFIIQVTQALTVNIADAQPYALYISKKGPKARKALFTFIWYHKSLQIDKNKNLSKRDQP